MVSNVIGTNGGLIFRRENLKDLFHKVVFTLLIGIYFCFFLLLVGLIASRAEAKTVVYGSTAEQVRIVYGTPTVFRFEKAVQTVTGAGRLQVEPTNKGDYSSLSITPRFTNGVHDVTFFLVDKAVVRAKILVSPKDPAADSFYDFKSRDSVESGIDGNAPALSEIELLKAMYRDDSVSGYKVMRMSQGFPSKNGSQVDLVRIYQGKPFNGYVFRVRNTSWRKNLEIDVRHITVGNPSLAILSQSDESTLFPKGKGVNETLVRVVAKNTASSRDVILAMEPEPETKPKGGE